MMRCQTFLVFLVCFVSCEARYTNADCPCSDPRLCERIAVPDRKEVFAYAVNLTHYKQFDWSKLTTIVVYESPIKKTGMELVCYAHQHNVRVLIATSVSEDELINATARTNNIQRYFKIAEKYFMDGANIDIELATTTEVLRTAFTAYVKETKETYSATYPHSLVATDVFWLPNIYHQTSELAKYSDFLFIMAYDEQADMPPPCVARANAPLYQTKLGVDIFEIVGVPKSKLVLGVPWYGYVYNCTKLTMDRWCHIERVEGHCTQHIGSEINFSVIRSKILPNSIDGQHWSDIYQSPFVNYKAPWGVQQIWYDNVESVEKKYAMVEKMDLRGVGIWTVDSLNYDNSSDPTTKEMWNALPSVK